jgi:hypothetical protein
MNAERLAKKLPIPELSIDTLFSYWYETKTECKNWVFPIDTSGYAGRKGRPSRPAKVWDSRPRP